MQANTRRIDHTIASLPHESYDLGVPPSIFSAKGESSYYAESAMPPQFAAAPHPTKSRFESLSNFYNAVSWILGFKEKYSLALLILFGGALVGFCLARTIMMNPANIRDLTVSGEWFWYRQSVYKPSVIIHVYLSIISGIFAVFQFIPAIRWRTMIFHHVNGYCVLVLLIPSTIAGSIVGRRAFGGDLNVQSSFYLDGILIIFSSAMGIINVRRTRKHRKWMLRTVTYASVPVTARLASLASRHIVGDMGTYHAVWSCDQLRYVMTDVNAVNTTYPQCTQSGVNLANVFVAVRAAARGDGLSYASAVRLTFGMAMWVALVFHVIGVEIYIRMTESSNQHRRGFVLERNDDDTLKSRADDY